MAGVRIDRAAGLAREHGADDVANRKDFRALLAGFALRSESVRRFAGLADGNDQAMLIENRIAVTKFAAVIDLDGEMSEALDHEFAGESCVPTGAAGDNFYVAEIAELFLGDVHLVEKYLAGFLRNSAEQSVADGAGLLENFLLHEMFEAALFGHDRVPGDVLGRAADRMTFKIEEANALRSEHGYFAISQEKNTAGMLEDGGNITSHEEFVLAETDNNRWT